MQQKSHVSTWQEKEKDWAFGLIRLKEKVAWVWREKKKIKSLTEICVGIKKNQTQENMLTKF